ncbi:MAG: class I SAM-dependent methyltransferase [Chloroflexota bacterium]
MRNRIAQQGPITFAEFMDVALYHPEHGYYASGEERFGPAGDFNTSPTTHPAFGALIGCQLVEMWDLLERPANFTIVEMGAGDGRLCCDVLRALRIFCPALYRKLRYVLIERSLRQRQRQVMTLARLLSKRQDMESVEILEDSSLDGVTGCFLSNELVDAFPVHRVVKMDGRLKEVYVGVEGDRFVDVLGELSTPTLQDHLQWLEIELSEGQYGEVNLIAPEWLCQVASRLSRGFVLTIDYGYPAKELYAPRRREGTLLTYRRHCHGKNLYSRVGQQDLTSHVDFSALVKTGLSIGLEFTGLTTQQMFLMQLGLKQYAEALRSLRLPAAELQANVRAMDALIRPDELGGHKVLVQHKGVVAPKLAGLGAAPGRGPDVLRHALKLPRLGRGTESVGWNGLF